MHSTHDNSSLPSYLPAWYYVLPIAASCCVPIIEPLRVADQQASLTSSMADDIPVHHDDEAASAVFLAVQMI